MQRGGIPDSWLSPDHLTGYRIISWIASDYIFKYIDIFEHTVYDDLMNKNEWTAMTASEPDQRSALASPLRLEILGLFTGNEPLAIADMAGLMGRTAGSLYYHIGILEKARLLRRAGTRPKGKRHEALFYPTTSLIDLEAEKGGESAELALKAMSSAFRMAERDLEAAFRRSDYVTEGPGRNVLAFRLHLRVSPKLLAGVNEHLEAIDELVRTETAKNPGPSPDDQHLSLTFALLPLRGRGKQEPGKGV